MHEDDGFDLSAMRDEMIAASLDRFRELDELPADTDPSERKLKLAVATESLVAAACTGAFVNGIESVTWHIEHGYHDDGESD